MLAIASEEAPTIRSSLYLQATCIDGYAGTHGA